MNKAKEYSQTVTLFLVVSAFGDRNGREQGSISWRPSVCTRHLTLNLALSQIQQFPVPCSLVAIAVCDCCTIIFSDIMLYIKTNVMLSH